MAYSITSDCIACGSCSVVCPQQAVDDGYADGGRPGGGGAGLGDSGHYRIAASCDQCGRCVAVCPTGAIIDR